MCGIFGYIGKKNAVEESVRGLEKLEYRGYDSAGIAFFNKTKEIEIVKEVGEVKNLKKATQNKCSNIAIAHTRWATHGKPSTINCHPHYSENFVIVHNGIIENYCELKEEINEELYSETDTEVVAKLLNKNYEKQPKEINVEEKILTAIKETSSQLKGSWAIAVLCKDDPKSIYILKNKSPIVVFQDESGTYVSSDINAINSKNNEKICFFSLKNNNIAKINEKTIQFYDNNLNLIQLKKIKKQNNETKENINFEHNMLKEINEIPQAIFETKKKIINSTFKKFVNAFNNFSSITIVGCGTAYHAGLYGKFVFENMLNKKVSVELASEFRYKKQILEKNSLVLAISQSGETADTIAAVEIAKQNGATTAVITNVSGSSITRLCDFVFLTYAGQEVAVAATKSYVSQLFVLYRLACSISKTRLDRGLWKKAQNVIDCFEKCKIEKFFNNEKFFFIGRQCDSATALEGSLKIKEISYVQSEGYPAGELKHGTLSLVDGKSLVVAIITQNNIKEKTLNAIHEVLARGANVLIVSQFEEFQNEIKIPKCKEIIMPLISVIPIQLFAYHFSVFKGLNPDKPRNLAKSVTVE